MATCGNAARNITDNSIWCGTNKNDDDWASAAKRSRSASADASNASLCQWRACGCQIEPGASRVEAAVVFEGSPDTSSKVVWESGSTLHLHRDCWDKLLGAEEELPLEERMLVVQARAAVEKFDSENDVLSKANRAAEILKSSKNAICFTGAGLSTSAGLGDYRGKRGKWTLEAQGVGTPYTTVYEELRPTFAHEAVAKLVDMDILKYVVSQNADGLHHLSGIPYTKLSDVHGSAFTEYCVRWKKRYVRDFYTPEDRAEAYFAGKLPEPIPEHIRKCTGCGSNHATGRQCDDCGGPLRDTVISFGDALEDCVLIPAFCHAQKADACLSLGSTMSIGPSNQVILIQKGPLIACVRQDTEMDSRCKEKGGVRAYADCDFFMEHVMKFLLGDDFNDWMTTLAGKRTSYDDMRPRKGKQRGDIFVKKF